MAYPLALKEKAIFLRKLGYSINEISNLLKIAKSTSSNWLSSIGLDDQALARLAERKVLGQHKANVTKQTKRQKVLEGFLQRAGEMLEGISLDTNLSKLLCSFLFWAEGEKNVSYVTFVNSDPKMVSLFLLTLRKGFSLEEHKFRALVHIHEYHSDKEIKEFWSQITKIPLSQFTKSYLKPHTGKNTRSGYKGSISVRYYDYKIALELNSIYNTFSKKYTGVG
ncbi:hypothetical protein A2631_01335 [Candidatus Daviesbacteria bacterium RIFCSPHIGHO2_01_FULL_44_29]|uniref:Uncharacterized protein n=1 Tax=Candidatus Daviesbacteria bacterium RIFCSPHIGHO2_02_FULL_43_12 TaxID=1797776 RepID=A0A1F5KKY9_9BACT|nr:MAG: hypothetical protein A2631_01335 [Candidatus Daviesbacteria bacterium RIFCSPHIGHO2_01_FULL_44_29]OGE39676.1 MAG: hypothetical protein A3E86_00035 [Candidatus Daviesbacteria bacterium RIFCSPHIGHO2_12_FULL_47_45]OGE41534.1 MAG: hypothetical protein A3D25_00755 [Candidatus Daviesbacteria bacterium RIFCSPHIGHO2_02_FULL_43_12]OGE69816.1 MAG: hypothetical protein A3B55_05400 [Candidatus Daviesbacteria bacterium RIFCSPLOWO2_01_FULL_43_15]